MTQLQMLGVGLLVFAACCSLANFKMQNHIRFKNAPQVFTRKSHPGLFEAADKATRTMTALGVILGIFFLLIRP